MLRLRLDPHAQYEIRVFAEAIAEFVKLHCPWTWEAFEDYWQGGVSFSKGEIDVLRYLIPFTGSERFNTATQGTTLSKGELLEFEEKFNRIVNGQD
jgi:thymidylate synthase (FAD)